MSKTSNFQTNDMKVADIAKVGYRMIREAKLHPHFFEDHSLLKESFYLTLPL
jgi:hypothetical protein